MLHVHFTRFAGDRQEGVAMVQPVQEENQNSSIHPMVVCKASVNEQETHQEMR